MNLLLLLLSSGEVFETVIVEEVTDCISVLLELAAAAVRALLNVDVWTAVVNELDTAVAALDDEV